MRHPDRVRQAYQGLCEVCLAEPAVEQYHMITVADGSFRSVLAGFFCTKCNLKRVQNSCRQT
jgi:hypothetical protein